MAEILLKFLGIIGATIVAYGLATKEEGTLRTTHPFAALFLELGTLVVIFCYWKRSHMRPLIFWLNTWQFIKNNALL